jgi:hypothetical protein
MNKNLSQKIIKLRLKGFSFIPKGEQRTEGIMMERIIRYAAYLANLVLIASAFIIMLKSYGGRDALLAGLLSMPPILSLLALYMGPDAEERQLHRDVTKARLRKELKDLST